MQTTPVFLLENQKFENISLHRELDGAALFMSMDVRPRPCMSWNLIRDFLSFQKRFVESLRFDAPRPQCLVYASHTPGIFSLGGDLSLFQRATETKDRTMLTRYVEDCALALNNFINTPETVTISLLEGDTFGGGLELALSSDVVIAERRVRAGFPEVLFNLIPGAGGYYLLARRVGPRVAERMIREGNVHTAEELHALGVVDILVDDGQGRAALRDLLESQKKSWNTYQALQHVKRHYVPITPDMLFANAKIWVDAVMSLTDRDLRMMKRLINAQQKRVGEPVPAVAATETVQRAAA